MQTLRHTKQARRDPWVHALGIETFVAIAWHSRFAKSDRDLKVHTVSRLLRSVLPELLLVCGFLCAGIAWLISARAAGETHSTRLPALENGDRTADCGAASLYVIAKLNGRAVNLAELRTITKTSIIGADMLSLKEASVRLGFDAEACRVTYGGLFNHLSGSGSYSILYSPAGHYFAAVGTEADGRIRIVDTCLGVIALTEIEMHRVYSWDGVALLLASH
jgi:hypothetical protein